MAWNGVTGEPWERWQLDTLTWGRTKVNGIYRLTYKEVAELTGKSYNGVVHCAERMCLTEPGTKGVIRVDDATRARIKALMPELIEDRRFTSSQIQKHLRAKGINVSKNLILETAKSLGKRYYKLYLENAARRRQLNCYLATQRRMARWRKANGKDAGSKSQGQG